jgi:fermentation-respiration switch protein FrsA (DUF1100 family)
MTRMWSAAVLALAVALVVVGLIWIGQRRLIYFPDPTLPTPAQAGLTAVEAVEIPVEDGGILHGWFLPGPRQPVPFTVVVFNGNAGNRAYRAPLAASLRSRGLSVLLFDYRGYGDSPGRPTQQGLEADARAVRAYVIRRTDVQADRVVYFGESLGSAVATILAAEHPPAALVLRSPFTSLADVGRIHYPILPVRWLLADRFASIDVIADVRSPVLVVAGDRVWIVPRELSQQLFDKAREPKELVIVPGADHNDLELLTGELMIGAMLKFLERVDRQ